MPFARTAARQRVASRAAARGSPSASSSRDSAASAGTSGRTAPTSAAAVTTSVRQARASSASLRTASTDPSRNRVSNPAASKSFGSRTSARARCSRPAQRPASRSIDPPADLVHDRGAEQRARVRPTEVVTGLRVEDEGAHIAVARPGWCGPGGGRRAGGARAVPGLARLVVDGLAADGDSGGGGT
ncbi:MAG: hypothetical protein GEV28_39580 [Actinophytocola sp.]|uniref:hypothetical protein n=1 Tax=Actinophytocola sp. TaxID=1872138 RepID=UPI001321373A|nr:hypothetical protein [Actinophytocola sp.]MPZ86151.1 hypothetical protein [Actinophytocola sp.]